MEQSTERKFLMNKDQMDKHKNTGRIGTMDEFLTETIDSLTEFINQETENMETFQNRVEPWTKTCFGEMIAADVSERNHRFLEEALELVQSCDCSREEAHLLVDYVFDRERGEKHQELGGVMVTLAALSNAQGLNMHEAGDTELARVWTKIEAIRAKQAAKPKNTPLPQ